ncbi:hypothetical protein TrLO_g7403 [Triparma laevis f. longispina]|uniref:Uncharacterized protein n=1 Tax=Triparma laevis f. longispina TaxID=1714387 RepID=A0A9W7F673_9STRA|nr:hypothetical protein TrLO_g7403 [Triparma laevis f. longispina]
MIPSYIRDLERVQAEAYERLRAQVENRGVLDPATPRGTALSMCLLLTEHVLETDEGKRDVEWHASLLRSCADLLNPVHSSAKLKGTETEASLLNFRLEVLCSKQLDVVKEQRKEDDRLRAAEDEIKEIQKVFEEKKRKILAKAGKKPYRKATIAKVPKRSNKRRFSITATDNFKQCQGWY